MEDRKETYSEDNPNGRWRKYKVSDLKDEKRLDLKWIQAEDDAADLSLSDLLGMIKEESDNIANAVAELEKLIGKVDE